MRSALLLIASTSLLTLTVGLYACSTHAPSDQTGTGAGTPATENAQGSSAPNTPVAESRAKGVLIGTIVTHDQRVSILGRGPTGSDIRVVVKKEDGTLVADGITLDELRRIDPTAHALVTNAVAGDGTQTGDFVDATNTKGQGQGQGKAGGKGATTPRNLGAPQGGQPLHLLDF